VDRGGVLALRTAGLSAECSLVALLPVESALNFTCLQIVAGFVAGVASLAGKASADVTPVDLFDDRKKTKGTGFEIIYEARDLDLPQNERDGITQFKADLGATKARYTESAKRITGPLGEFIDKSYW
jgi:photosystem II oxygen-evolving enhancer protein 3